jgi:hypothetical protein
VDPEARDACAPLRRLFTGHIMQVYTKKQFAKVAREVGPLVLKLDLNCPWLYDTRWVYLNSELGDAVKASGQMPPDEDIVVNTDYWESIYYQVCICGR